VFFCAQADKRILDDLRLTLHTHNIVAISERLRYYERGVERVRAEIRALLEARMVDDRPAHG